MFSVRARPSLVVGKQLGIRQHCRMNQVWARVIPLSTPLAVPSPGSPLQTLTASLWPELRGPSLPALLSWGEKLPQLKQQKCSVSWVWRLEV